MKKISTKEIRERHGRRERRAIEKNDLVLSIRYMNQREIED
jgi:hypothetical protein